MPLRKVLFWLHLACGCLAGVIILAMSLTGVLLTYERQILAAWERGAYRAPTPANAARLPVDRLLDAIRRERGDLPADATLTQRSDPAEPVEIRIGRERAIYASPYSGHVLGEGAAGGARVLFQKVTAWHRWLGVEGTGRATARAITGACNLFFLVLVVSGAYLWLPRRWSWPAVRSVIWFRGAATGKARDFNWHNVFGVWALIPVFFVVLSAVPMSYSWANDLLYRLSGSEPPPPLRGEGGPGGPGGERRGPRGKREQSAAPDAAVDLNQLWRRAQIPVPAWKSITARVAVSRGESVTFTIDAGDGGQPQKRSTLTLDAASARMVKFETFASASPGRRLRSWSRFVHTGEYYGMVGQTIAGIASLAGVMLVWTGIALALRRFVAWRSRGRDTPASADQQAPVGVGPASGGRLL